jgi:hypothetical protein
MQELKIKLPEVIGARLRQFERGRKRVLLLRGLGECVLLFCVGLLVLSLVEWVLHLRLASRIWLSGANYFLLGVCSPLAGGACPSCATDPSGRLPWSSRPLPKAVFKSGSSRRLKYRNRCRAINLGLAAG